MRTLTTISWQWVPDIAANLLAVSMIVLTLIALMPPPASSVISQQQKPQGPEALVEALWQRLHMQEMAIFDLDTTGLRQIASQGEGQASKTSKALLFVLSQAQYAQAVNTLRQAGFHWVEITVPAALGGPEGWREGFLDLTGSPISRTGFEAQLARLLRQGAGSSVATVEDLSSVDLSRGPRIRIILMRFGNGMAFLFGFALLIGLFLRYKRYL